MKKLLTMMIAAALLSAAGLAAADCPYQEGKDKRCHASERRSGQEEYQCPITAKLMQKAEFYLDNAEAIGLSDAQVQQIKGIKREAQKDYVRQKAEMQVLFLDVDAKLAETPVDVTTLNVMADSASAGMAKAMKGVVEQFAALKTVLTEEQVKQAKAVWKQKQP